MGLIGNIKEVVEVLQKADNVEISRKLIAIQTEAMTLLEENRTLRDRITKLEQLLQVREELDFAHNAYWLPRKDGTLDGPFCANAWDRQDGLIRCHFLDHIQWDTGQVYRWKGTNNETFRVPAEWIKKKGVFPAGDEPPITKPNRIAII